MANTELISFDMFDFEQTQEEKRHKGEFQQEEGDPHKPNLCVTSVKVVQNLH